MKSAKKSKKVARAVASAGPPFWTRLKKNCRKTMFRTIFRKREMEAMNYRLLVSRWNRTPEQSA